MELDLGNDDLTIEVYNKSYEDVTVTVSARTFFKLLDGNVIFFWYKWVMSAIFTTNVCAGQRKRVSQVTAWNAITYKLGSYNWRLYNIKVQRKSDGYIAMCATPLHCTWIIEEAGIYQEDDPENRCKFKPSPSNSCT